MNSDYKLCCLLNVSFSIMIQFAFNSLSFLLSVGTHVQRTSRPATVSSPRQWTVDWFRNSLVSRCLVTSALGCVYIREPVFAGSAVICFTEELSWCKQRRWAINQSITFPLPHDLKGTNAHVSTRCAVTRNCTVILKSPLCHILARDIHRSLYNVCYTFYEFINLSHE